MTEHPRRLPNLDGPRHRLTVTLPPDLYRQVCTIAEHLGVTRSYAINTILAIGAEAITRTREQQDTTREDR